MKEALQALIEAHGVAMVVEMLSALCLERSYRLHAAGDITVANAWWSDSYALHDVVWRLSN